MNFSHLWSYHKVRLFRPPPGVQIALSLNFTTGAIKAELSRGLLVCPVVVDSSLPTTLIHTRLRRAAESVLAESCFRESVRSAEDLVRLVMGSEARYG